MPWGRSLILLVLVLLAMALAGGMDQADRAQTDAAMERWYGTAVAEMAERERSGTWNSR